jgi:GNAT superfamily N-acetyltransferase/catechol 2,3-dioxygenase-like lactoylglutathione lyase family enzyme
MKFRNAVPILYSENVIRSLDYYTETLGFDGRWDWGKPPTFGCVYKDSVQIFFCEKAQGNPGTWLSVFVQDVDAYYEDIKAKGAKILASPNSMEWGIREMLVEDPDGHKIRFGQPVSVRGKSSETIPDTIRIVARTPSVKELNRLIASVGWASTLDDDLNDLPLFGVEFITLAQHEPSGEIVGCAFLLGDRAGFYYIKNVIVRPEWQSKRIGTALMNELTRWLDENAPDKSFVGLHTGEQLEPFYKMFGFGPAYGMCRRIYRNNDTRKA